MYNTPVMKYTVKFINESAKNLKLKATVGTQKQKAYADSLRQMVIDRFKDEVDEELIYHVLNSDTWRKASDVIRERQLFYNNDGRHDNYWKTSFEQVAEEVSTINLGKTTKSVDLFIPANKIMRAANMKNYKGDIDRSTYYIVFESPIHKVVQYDGKVVYMTIIINCPAGFVVSNDESGIKLSLKKKQGRVNAHISIDVCGHLSDLENGIENAGNNGVHSYYATDREDRGGWAKVVEIINKLNAGFKN